MPSRSECAPRGGGGWVEMWIMKRVGARALELRKARGRVWPSRFHGMKCAGTWKIGDVTVPGSVAASRRCELGRS
eukprot:5937849-Prymnesium_polylepis.2